MPVFRIYVKFSDGKATKTYRLDDKVDLDTFYVRVLRFFQIMKFRNSSFEVVQISEHTREAMLMRQNNWKEMSLDTARPRVKPNMYRQRRRF